MNIIQTLNYNGIKSSSANTARLHEKSQSTYIGNVSKTPESCKFLGKTIARIGLLAIRIISVPANLLLLNPDKAWKNLQLSTISVLRVITGTVQTIASLAISIIGLIGYAIDITSPDSEDKVGLFNRANLIAQEKLHSIDLWFDKKEQGIESQRLSIRSETSLENLNPVILINLKYGDEKSIEPILPIFLELVKNNPEALELLSDDLRNNREIVAKAMQNNGLALQFVPDSLKIDKTIVTAAVQNNGLALQFTSIRLKNDEAVVTAAVQNNGLALQFASSKLKNDKAIATAAMQNNGLALQFAHDSLKIDKAVVTAAVQNNDLALQFASSKLKNDEAVVTAAVQNNGLSLQFASENLKNDKRFLIELIQKHPHVYQFISDDLRIDLAIAKTAVKADPDNLYFYKPGSLEPNKKNDVEVFNSAFDELLGISD